MKRLILVLLIALMADGAWAAKPLRSGIYIGTKAGATRVSLKRESEKKDDVVLPFALELGLRIRNFRVEAEYYFETKAEYERYSQETETITAQFYYDVPFKSAIRPYVNFGMGRHKTQIKEERTLTQPGFKEVRKDWMWNAGAGVTWNISNAVNMDIGYRYWDIGDFKTQTGTVKTAHHSIYIGWRYVF